MGKVLIFGACGLIGSELVSSLSNLQIELVLVDREFTTCQFEGVNFQKQKHNPQFISADITSAKDLEKIFASFDYISGIVNCSYPKNEHYGKHLEEVTLENFNENVNMQLGSSYEILRNAVLHFKKTLKPISIISLGSIYGSKIPDFRLYEKMHFTMPIEYAASKSALEHINRYIVKYVNNSEFRSNIVSPGGIRNKQPELFQNRYDANCLGTGLLDPADVVGVIKFLLSRESQFINAQNIIVDDGFSLR